jgi:NADH dehydrogenase
LAVRDTLQLVDHSHVYAIGDVAYLEKTGKPLAGVAPEALQQGVAVAQNLRRQRQGQPLKPFRYWHKGRLAIIGGYGGVGCIAGIDFGGWAAWLLWLAVHAIYLPGYRSRLLVLLTWVQNYLLGDRALRQLFPVAQRESRPTN